MDISILVKALQRTARAARAAHPRPWSLWRFVRHLGFVGLFLLAIIDSTPIPTLGGVDFLVAILAARHLEPWWFYALVATSGSVLGAYVTFHAARVGGADYLQRKFGKKRVTNFLSLFDRWGTTGLVVSAAVPFPFPTSAFFAAAGVLDYPVRRFLAVVAGSRGARYLTISLVAFEYGRHFVRAIRHPSQYYGWLAAIAVVVVGVILLGALISKRLNAPEMQRETDRVIG